MYVEKKPRPSLIALWDKAQGEFPDNPQKKKERYRELMVEYGHLVEGRPEPLSCGFGGLGVY